MDSTALVTGFDVEAGVRLIQALDGAGVPVKAAFWLFREESEEWRLYIATPLVGQHGPRAAYAKVLDEAGKIGTLKIGPSSLTVVDSNEELVRLLSAAIRTGDDISGIAFSRNTINGVYIPPAYIYRMNP